MWRGSCRACGGLCEGIVAGYSVGVLGGMVGVCGRWGKFVNQRNK